MKREHTVKSFDKELQSLRDNIFAMGKMARSMLGEATRAALDRDEKSAATVIRNDNKVDHLENQTSLFAVRILALRQPMANDLRHIVTTVKIASDIERIADYATSIARRTRALRGFSPIEPEKQVQRMNTAVDAMLGEALESYHEADFERSLEIWDQDREIDAMYVSLFRELVTYMIEDPRCISLGIHLLFIAKNLERIGDHVTNIAESMYYLAHGKPLIRERPWGDEEAKALALGEFAHVDPPVDPQVGPQISPPVDPPVNQERKPRPTSGKSTPSSESGSSKSGSSKSGSSKSGSSES